MDDKPATCREHREHFQMCWAKLAKPLNSQIPKLPPSTSEPRSGPSRTTTPTSTTSLTVRRYLYYPNDQNSLPILRRTPLLSNLCAETEGMTNVEAYLESHHRLDPLGVDHAIPSFMRVSTKGQGSCPQ